MPPSHFRLRIKSLKFISAVDRGAQGPISNVALIKRAPAGDEIEAVCTVSKVDEKLGIVFGWALATTLDGGATPHIDLQDDAIVGDDELIKVAAAFMEAGAASDVLHDDNPDGKIVFAMPLTKEVNAALGIKSDVHGLAIGMKPSPETFKRFVSGELAAFSIGGVGEREPVEKAATPRRRRKRRPGAWTGPDGKAGSPDFGGRYTGADDGNAGNVNARPETFKRESFGKMATLTSTENGHAHSLDLDAPLDEWCHFLQTSEQTAEGAASPHSHCWIYDLTSGAITIGADSGHTHTVSVAVPPDVLAAAVAEEAEDAEEAEEAAAEPTETPTPDDSHTPTTIVIAAPSEERPHGSVVFAYGDVNKWLAAELPNDTERVRIARLNPEKPWAAPWIEKGTEMDEQADFEKQAAEVEITFEKSMNVIKSLVTKRATAEAAHDAYIGKVAAERKVHPGTAMISLIDARDAEYLKLYEAHDAAHMDVVSAHQHIAAPKIAFITKQLDDVTAQIHAAEEAFSLAHNIESYVAQDRLLKISPTFKALYEKSCGLTNERDMARLQATALTEQAHSKMREDAFSEREAAGIEQRKRAERPAERALREHVERFGKSAGIARYEQALVKALDVDDTARSLYELADAERAA